jgi:hypothetical protein
MRTSSLERIDSDMAGNPAVHKVFAFGYEIRYRREVKRPFLRIEAFHDGKSVGFLLIELITHKRTQQVDNIVVLPEHRRKGLANAMIVCAEVLTGLLTVPAAVQTTP